MAETLKETKLIITYFCHVPGMPQMELREQSRNNDA